MFTASNFLLQRSRTRWSAVCFHRAREPFQWLWRVELRAGCGAPPSTHPYHWLGRPHGGATPLACKAKVICPGGLKRRVKEELRQM